MQVLGTHLDQQLKLPVAAVQVRLVKMLLQQTPGTVAQEKLIQQVVHLLVTRVVGAALITTGQIMEPQAMVAGLVAQQEPQVAQT